MLLVEVIDRESGPESLACGDSGNGLLSTCVDDSIVASVKVQYSVSRMSLCAVVSNDKKLCSSSNDHSARGCSEKTRSAYKFDGVSAIIPSILF